MRLPNPYGTPLLTIEVAGQLLGMSRPTAYRAARAGTLPTTPVGGRPMVRTVDLYAFLGLPLPPAGPAPIVAR